MKETNYAYLLILLICCPDHMHLWWMNMFQFSIHEYKCSTDDAQNVWRFQYSSFGGCLCQATNNHVLKKAHPVGSLA